MLRHKGSQKTKLCLDKRFICHEIFGEVLEEQCRDIPYSVATLIKANGSGTLSRHFTTLSQLKELKMTEKLCRHKRQLCRYTKFKVSIKRQEDSIARKTSIVVTKVEKNYKKNVVTQKIMSRHNEELKAEISVETMIEKFLNHNVTILLAMS